MEFKDHMSKVSFVRRLKPLRQEPNRNTKVIVNDLWKISSPSDLSKSCYCCVNFVLVERKVNVPIPKLYAFQPTLVFVLGYSSPQFSLSRLKSLDLEAEHVVVT